MNDPPVFLQEQPATSNLVGPGAGHGMVSISETHSVMDPNAYVVSALVLKHARMYSSIH